MTLLRNLSRLIIQPAISYGQLSTGIASGLKAGFPVHGVAQCNSLLSFVQTRLLSTRSEGVRLLNSFSNQQLALGSSRGFASKLTPRFTGCKLKPYSSYKERFKMTGSGKIRYMRPGSVHKHFNKGNRQNRDLAKSQVLHETYAKTMRKLGFKMRHF